MLVDLYAVIHEKEKGVPCMRCFSCALLLGRTFESFMFGLRTKKNLKTFLNLGFPALGQTDSAQISLNIFH